MQYQFFVCFTKIGTYKKLKHIFGHKLLPKMSLIEKRNTFNSLVKNVLELISNDPKLLKKSNAAIKTKLQSQGKEDSQGTGNQVTPQETSFAMVLEDNGFKFISKAKKNDHIQYIKNNSITNGHYYIYQVNGNQASIDFAALLIEEKEIIAQYNFDLKHTTSKIFYLNDGWFHNDTIYIITWCSKKNEVQSFIGLGQNIPTKEEQEEMSKLIKFKKEINTDKKRIGSLYTYIRFANRYSCEQFTESFTKENYEKVKELFRTNQCT